MCRLEHSALLTLCFLKVLLQTRVGHAEEQDGASNSLVDSGSCPIVQSPPTCSAYEEFFPHIQADFDRVTRFGRISSVNVSEVLARVKKQHAGSWDLYFLEVAIINGSLSYRAGHRQLGGWQIAALKLIEKALRLHSGWFEDVYFILSCLDAPVFDSSRTPPLPIFGLVGSRSSWDIMVPGIAFYESSGGISSKKMTTNMQLWQTNAWQAQLQDQHPWENRTEKAFFRGHDWDSSNQYIETSPGYLAGEHSEACTDAEDITNSFGYRRWYHMLTQEPGGELSTIADVGLTGVPAHKLKSQPKVRMAQPVRMEEHARYKYLLHLDGSTFSNRLIKLLLMGSVVLKQDSPYEEYFYRLLQPYVHYVPVARDRCSTSNLTSTVHWLRDNDSKAKAIGDAGLLFARRLLTVEAAACYWHRLLAIYAALQDFKPAKVIKAGHFHPWPPEQVQRKRRDARRSK